MKKIFKKSNIFSFLLGAILFGGIVGVSAYTIFADNIGYTPKDTTWKKSNGEDITNVKDAIDELYNKANGFCYGKGLKIGTPYVCDPGDEIYRIFYVLKVNDDTVELIMDRNISDEVGNAKMNYETAMSFFTIGSGVNTKTAWTNVKNIEIPDAQVIADASGIIGWDVTKATADDWSVLGTNSHSDNSKKNSYAWLYNYTRGCVQKGCSNGYPDSTDYNYGYWLKNLVSNDSNNAWLINRNGDLGTNVLSHADYGVRPVITVSKSNLVG